MNELLKQISTESRKYKRDDVLKWLENPKAYEQQLIELNQYLLNSSMHFRRLADYFIEMLTFDYIIVSDDVGLTEKEMTSSAYKKSRKNVLNWLKKFNVKDEGRKVFRIMIEEDVGFFYKRENNNKITFQRLPSAWCKLVNRNEFGFTYAFNFMFFWRLGININDYPPEFLQYINDIEEGRRKDNTYAYWVTLDPEKAVAFKFNEDTGIIKSPFLGLFLDILEISEFKNLIKSKSVLDNFILLTQRIPMRTDKDAKKNDFLIDLDIAAKFHDAWSSQMPQGVAKVTTPMEITAQRLDSGNKSQSRQSIVGYAEQQFYSSGGTSDILFGGKTNGSIGLNLSIKVDESWVFRFYRQFERWINYQLRMISGKYRFKIVFPDLTYYNRSDKFDQYLKASQAGFPPQLAICALGMTPLDFENLCNMAISEGILDKLRLLVLPSSHVQSGNEAGRPELPLDKLSPKGDAQRTREDNKNDAGN